MAIIAGVEEAGRGPVIGPLVMAIVTIDEKDEQKLKDLGVKDSKLVAKHKRSMMYQKIIDTVLDYKIIKVSPSEIDNALDKNNPDMNLNWLEATTSAKLINSVKLDKVILDCPSSNVNAYKNYVNNLVLRKENGMRPDIVAEHKADVKYTIVGAASIIAKVTRDSLIEGIKKKYNIEFGSGYPSDPKTRQFLEKNYNKYPFFRKSWSSYKRLVQAQQKNQKKLGDF